MFNLDQQVPTRILSSLQRIMYNRRNDEMQIPAILWRVKDDLETFALFHCEFVNACLVVHTYDRSKMLLTINSVRKGYYTILYNFWEEEYCEERLLKTTVKEILYERGHLPIYKAYESVLKSIQE